LWNFLIYKEQFEISTNKKASANGIPIKIPREKERSKGTVTKIIIIAGLAILRKMIFK
jgi:hypothetical protein